MKFGVLVFPGSNCDRDMQDALEKDLGFEVQMLWHKDSDLSHFNTEDCICLLYTSPSPRDRQKSRMPSSA